MPFPAWCSRALRSWPWLRPHPRVQAVWRHQASLSRGFVSDASLPALIGGVLLGGGWGRVTSGGFATLRESGGPYVWGSIFLAVGLALGVTPAIAPAVVLLGYRAVAVLAGVYALMFAHSWATDPHASLTGALLWGYVAWQAVSRSDAYRPEAAP